MSRESRSSAIPTAEIRTIILRLLTGLGFGYPQDAVFPIDFFVACCDRAHTYGYALSGKDDFRPYLVSGAIISYSAYKHTDEDYRMFLALYCASNIAHDDTIASVDLELFTSRMLQGLPQPNSSPNLDATTRFLMDISSFNIASIVVDMAVAVYLNFIVAMRLENMSTSMKIHSQAQAYPPYKRYLSGFSDFFAVAAFPRNIPLEEYIQAIPDFSRLICLVNDVLSFYKEEVAGETDNFVSDLSRLSNSTRLQAINDLTEESIALHGRIIAILGSCTPARQAYDSFIIGYVQFHTTATRYRLKELGIPVGAPFTEEFGN